MNELEAQDVILSTDTRCQLLVAVKPGLLDASSTCLKNQLCLAEKFNVSVTTLDEYRQYIEKDMPLITVFSSNG